MGAERVMRAVASRRRILQTILALATFGTARAGHAQAGTRVEAPLRPGSRPRLHALPGAVDLAADGGVSRARRIPILILFDRADCPYCERALREHLVPMSLEAPWRDDALFRQVEADADVPVNGFDRRPTTHRALATRYGAKLTPTVVVVDADGVPLADPIVGLLTADFYGAYLDEALRKGFERLRR